MPGAELEFSKYLLSEQMNNTILSLHVGHSQELGGLKANTRPVNYLTLLKLYSYVYCAKWGWVESMFSETDPMWMY